MIAQVCCRRDGITVLAVCKLVSLQLELFKVCAREGALVSIPHDLEVVLELPALQRTLRQVSRMPKANLK